MTAPFLGCEHSAQDWYRDRCGALRCSECEAPRYPLATLLLAAASLVGLVAGFLLVIVWEAAR